MTDTLSPERRSANMSKIRSTDSVPEMLVRRLAFRLGYRYRLHAANLPGKPDLVFPARRKVVFVHGCFWHQHQSCQEGRVPRSNTGYWAPKLERNVQRDAESRARLRAAGWKSLVVWECETKSEPRLKAKLMKFLG
jgi:DNA mismatch endonuclease, patch repair protein